MPILCSVTMRNRHSVIILHRSCLVIGLAVVERPELNEVFEPRRQPLDRHVAADATNVRLPESAGDKLPVILRIRIGTCRNRIRNFAKRSVFRSELRAERQPIAKINRCVRRRSECDAVHGGRPPGLASAMKRSLRPHISLAGSRKCLPFDLRLVKASNLKGVQERLVVVGERNCLGSRPSGKGSDPV